MDIPSEKDCNMLGTLFQNIISDWKTSSPAWDELVNKGFKFHSLLKSTTIAMSAFVETIQKIADAATHSKGSTKDVGSALTRVCVRQKMVEIKMKQFTGALMDNLLCPVQEKLEEWKKVAGQLEKEHAKDYKRATNEIKKRNNDTLRLQKKARKGNKPEVQHQLDAAMHDVNERFNLLEEAERAALRNLLVEERTRICLFANSLSPLIELQVSMLNDASHLQDLNTDLSNLCRNPKQLPTSTEQLVNDFVSNGSPPQEGSLQSSVSGSDRNLSAEERKFSTFSSGGVTTNGLNKSATVRLRHNQQPSSLPRHRRTGSAVDRPSSLESDRFSSVSSRDSGFVSVECNDVSNPSSFKTATHNEQSKSETTDPLRSIVDHAPISNQKAKFSWKDWSVPGPYDLIADNNSKEVSHVLPPPLSPKPVYFSHYPISDQVSSLTSPGQTAFDFPPPLPPLDNDLVTGKNEATTAFDDALPPPPPAFFIGGCPPPHNRDPTGSRNSLLCSNSSGYGSQRPTPASSEDTIASHDTDPNSFDDYEMSQSRKFSTLPRNQQRGWVPDLASGKYQRRPASTAELATLHLSGSSSDVSRVATIRRKPSSKLALPRPPSGLIPVQTPSIPSGGAVANLLSTFVPPSRLGGGFKSDAF